MAVRGRQGKRGPLARGLIVLSVLTVAYPLAPVGPEARPDTGVVVHVDAFGNVITSFDADVWQPGVWRVRAGEGAQGKALDVTAGRTYADVAPGALVGYVGSAGFIEIAVREGSAAAVTGWRRGATLLLEMRT